MKNESLIEVKEAADNEAKETTSKPAETENFATEIFRAFQAHSKFVIRGLIIGWMASVILGIAAFLWNNHEWRDLFNSYDYISQDGNGFNNINSGDQGDLNNGSEE